MTSGRIMETSVEKERNQVGWRTGREAIQVVIKEQNGRAPKKTLFITSESTTSPKFKSLDLSKWDGGRQR